MLTEKETLLMRVLFLQHSSRVFGKFKKLEGSAWYFYRLIGESVLIQYNLWPRSTIIYFRELAFGLAGLHADKCVFICTEGCKLSSTTPFGAFVDILGRTAAYLWDRPIAH